MIGPKTPKPTSAESALAYAQVKERSFGLCEICGIRRATETHHRLHKSHGVLDTVENLLRVCGWGNHTGCHGMAHSHSQRYAKGWAVRSGFDPADVPLEYRGAFVRLTRDGGIDEREVA